jgi:hypothetical protein
MPMETSFYNILCVMLAIILRGHMYSSSIFYTYGSCDGRDQVSSAYSGPQSSQS